jgi:4a-hydroxytetrahydrobiopterin dehydratase
MNLLNKKCVSCEGGVPPMSPEEIKKYSKEVPAWVVFSDHKKISREFKFKDFKEAMKFVNKVAEIAESEGHHPDIHIFYNRVNIELWTHAVNGLSENDFILAAKIDAINPR